MVATDTQKNTVYAFARDGVGSPEEFLLRARRGTSSSEFEWVTGGRWAAEQFAWERMRRPTTTPSSAPARRRAPPWSRSTATDVTVIAGLTDCTVLKSTGSEFHGFPRDRYTTLQETDDRILATSVTATWRYAGTDLDFDATYDGVRDLLLDDLRRPHSLALQQTIFAMGKAVARARTPRSPRSASPAPTSTTSWSTSSPSASTTRARSSSPPTAPTA